MRRAVLFISVVLCAVLAAQASLATTIQLSFASTSGDVGTAISLDSSNTGEFTENPDGTMSWVGEYIDAAIGEWKWDLLLKSDPFIAGVVAARNNSSMEGNFNFQVSMPISVDLPAGSPMFGASAITINDANNDGAATLSAADGGSIYNGIVAGTTVATLYDDPFSLSPAFPPSTGVANTGFSGVTSTAFSAGDIMSLRHTLRISAGDSATANSNFTIIPEPASILLLGAAGVVACAFTYRRRSRRLRTG